MQNIQIFESRQFGEIRVVEIGGKPWWVLKDVCKALAIKNHKMTAQRLDEDEVSLTDLIDRIGRKQKTTVISESGLYAVILRSDKPNAKAFRKWVTSEVLPTIRKHGGYITSELLKRISDQDEEMSVFLNALREERINREVLEDVVSTIAPKARYYDTILQCEDSIPVSIIAKDYGMTAAAFNKLLNTVGIQYKIRGTWLLRKSYCNKGYTVSRTFYIGENKSSVHTYWTQQGRKFIYDYLSLFDILPEVERELC